MKRLALTLTVTISATAGAAGILGSTQRPEGSTFCTTYGCGTPFTRGREWQ